MNILQAIILGIVQGLTEFIPVSSSAHLIFASRWTNLYNGNPEQTTATIAVLQLGTLLAAIIYFIPDIVGITSAFVRDHWNMLTRGRRNVFSGTQGIRPGWLSEEAWLGWLVIIGSIPIGVIGLLFKKLIEGSLTKNLWLIATMMIVIAIALSIAEMVGKQRTDISRLGIWDAIIVGFAQCIALIPGASRSGSTIMGGLFAGQRRETAARFSFLLMMPAVFASGILELKEAVKILSKDDLVPLLIGTIVSGIIGYLTIWFLLNYLKKNSTAIFIIYRLIVGTLILVALWRGLLSAQI